MDQTLTVLFCVHHFFNFDLIQKSWQNLHRVFQMGVDTHWHSLPLDLLSAYNILDYSLHKTCCCCFSVQFLCDLVYLSLFWLFHFVKNGLLRANLPLRAFLIKLKWTLDGPGEWSDASLRSCASFLLDFVLFLEGMSFIYCSFGLDIFFRFVTSFVLHLFSFFNFSKDTLTAWNLD